MKFDGLRLYSILVLLFVYGCQKDDDILPENARLKQVLIFSNITEKIPYDTIEIYQYNKQGRVSKVTTRDGYNLYEYNSIGQVIKIKNYALNLNSPSGYLLLLTYIYVYSGDGKLEKETIEDLNGYSTEYSLFIYTEGRLSKIEKYHYNTGELFESIEYVFDDFGQPIKEIKYFGNQNPYLWTVNSFSNGLMIKTEIYVDSNLEYKHREIVRTYDVNRNIKILESNDGSAMQSYVLRYQYFGE